MKIYTYSEARQRLAALLDQARRDGEVQIRRRDGQRFVVQPARPTGSPLDVPGLSTRVTTKELVDFVRESRRSTERLVAPRPSTGPGAPRKARRRAGSRRRS
jgi:antitoxin Phd